MNPATNGTSQGGGNRSRRDFLKVPLAASAAGALLYAGYSRSQNASQQLPGRPSAGLANQRGAARNVIDEYDPANIKVGHVVSANISDDDILFLKQIGLRSALVSFDPVDASFEKMRQTQERFARHDISIFSGLNHIYRSLKIQLGLPGRDEDIAQYQDFLRNLGRLGIRVAHYDFHPANTYTTSHATQRGYTAREFSLDDFRKKVEKQAFDREYSAEEMWRLYEYFMKAVLPVAEEADVRMALHPDDPPLAKMNGVAKLFTHYDGYHRAEEIAGGSKHWGLTFCVGTWSEGGDQMGKDVFEMIEDFGRRGKIFIVHFRNVSSPLPRFHETFPDDGYLDMYQVVKALREVGYSGSLVPDHIPQLVDDKGIQRAGLSYYISYIRASLRRANEEVG